MFERVIVKAYGKLNLYLDITGKREDGYHLLKSVMQSVSVYDTIQFTLANGEGMKLDSNSKAMPLDDTNLICKAVGAFYDYTGIKRQGRLHAYVYKNILSMAGMAGGSADCAAALYAVNALTKAGLTQRELCKIGAGLGADVPFTLTGGTVLCEGIGEKLTPLPTLKNMCFCVVKPDVGVSTPQAYKAYDSMEIKPKGDYESFLKALTSCNAEALGKTAFNALEAAVSLDEIKLAKQRLIENGARGAMMTGSGSAVFGIFDDYKKACGCREALRDYSFSQVLFPTGDGLQRVW